MGLLSILAPSLNEAKLSDDPEKLYKVSIWQRLANKDLANRMDAANMAYTGYDRLAEKERQKAIADMRAMTPEQIAAAQLAKESDMKTKADNASKAWAAMTDKERDTFIPTPYDWENTTTENAPREALGLKRFTLNQQGIFDPSGIERDAGPLSRLAAGLEGLKTKFGMANTQNALTAEEAKMQAGQPTAAVDDEMGGYKRRAAENEDFFTFRKPRNLLYGNQLTDQISDLNFKAATRDSAEKLSRLNLENQLAAAGLDKDVFGQREQALKLALENQIADAQFAGKSRDLNQSLATRKAQKELAQAGILDLSGTNPTILAQSPGGGWNIANNPLYTDPLNLMTGGNPSTLTVNGKPSEAINNRGYLQPTANPSALGGVKAPPGQGAPPPQTPPTRPAAAAPVVRDPRAAAIIGEASKQSAEESRMRKSKFGNLYAVESARNAAASIQRSQALIERYVKQLQAEPRRYAQLGPLIAQEEQKIAAMKERISKIYE